MDEKHSGLQVPTPLSVPEGDTTSSAVSLKEQEAGEPWSSNAEVVDEEGRPDSGNQTAAANFSTGEDTVAENGESMDYISGYKLVLLLISLTTFFFLLMLDMSIISTVS